MTKKRAVYRPENHIRMVTATSLFDGHDASINIMRRILQDSGVEVIHLGHNRSVAEFVQAAIDEDAQAIAMSSYQGGHMESFKYMIDLLRQKGAEWIRVFGGGGGVIVADEIRELEAYGVTKIFSPGDGTRLGLQGMIDHMVQLSDFPILTGRGLDPEKLAPHRRNQIAGFISAIQEKDLQVLNRETVSQITEKADGSVARVVGITGTGGAGKSSLTDEILFRFLRERPDMKIAVVCCDPSRRKTGGALLGDRIRMNSITSYPQVYMRSLATRKSNSEVSESLPEVLELLKAAGFELIIAETAGIGQGDSRIIDLADISLYVMTADYGAPSQLEKIDMLDFADIIVINKYEKKGSEDALRDIRRQVMRNRKSWDSKPEELPVFGTIASRFNDDGVSGLYDYLSTLLGFWNHEESRFGNSRVSGAKDIVIPVESVRYLSDIAVEIRKYHGQTKKEAEQIRDIEHLRRSGELIADLGHKDAVETLGKEAENRGQRLAPSSQRLLENWQSIRDAYGGEEYCYKVRGGEVKVPLYSSSLSQSRIPKVALPNFSDPGDIYAWLRREHLPGYFPYTAGVFPFKRMHEDPTRMFAGEGGPERTNRRFKLLSKDSAATRLSTAFDSVTLYGWDPDRQPDIYGKVGTSGVSVCSLDDIKTLYDGFDLLSPTTSVSMTINGPAPIVLAMFMNAAMDQRLERYEKEMGKQADTGVRESLRAEVLQTIRGTVQADILKEDQGQNTCIFSIEFALKMMGDIQEFFVANQVRNFYSVSVSGYHIAEAGANPVTQLALTLSNGFTYVEYYLARGMDINDIAPCLSFFFSNGMDPEYTVIGRVARRIWAVAMRERYGAREELCKLKYHIQTSGRSLHCQEIQFNDIRTTLQALCAIYDNCNSLHTNAYDEAITTPSSESVRRALAIQLIINREWGLAKNENPNQGSFIVDELTDLVEEAVLKEFERISERGGVLGAMETGYQRSRIQEESLYYEGLKHSGQYPIIGVNTFENPLENGEQTVVVELARATEEEKQEQLQRLEAFWQRNRESAPLALESLKQTVLEGGNIFAELMNTVRVCSLGQITSTLYGVGGQYRRNM